MEQEFDRQVENLMQKGYPNVLGISETAFKTNLMPLRDMLPANDSTDIEGGKLPFVIVVKSPKNESEKLMTLVEKDTHQGLSKLYPHDANEFHTIQNITLPNSIAYLLLDIDRGKGSLNVRPDEALVKMTKAKRSPLTIDEGIAIVTHYPEFLIRNNCFSLLGSRCPGNKRVPAIWINAAKRPNLGWCWDGNPHTWLGSASCGERRGL